MPGPVSIVARSRPALLRAFAAWLRQVDGAPSFRVGDWLATLSEHQLAQLRRLLVRGPQAEAERLAAVLWWAERRAYEPRRGRRSRTLVCQRLQRLLLLEYARRQGRVLLLFGLSLDGPPA